MAKIFVSYAHVDKANLVEPLVINVLKAGNHNVWYDWHLLPGQDWQEQLLQSIKDADIFVYALTPESVKSEHCLWEFEQAVLHGKNIIPVLLQKTDLPEHLKRLQYVNFTGGATAINVARLMAGIQAVDLATIEIEHEAPVQPPPQVTYTQPDAEDKPSPRNTYIPQIIIGILATVIGGLILNALIQQPGNNNNDSPTEMPTATVATIITEPPEQMVFIVDARFKEHYTGIDVEAGDTITIEYIEGQWTSNADTYDMVDAFGTSDDMGDEDFTLPYYPAMSLVGGIRDGRVRYIGDLLTFIADVDGELWLGTNDNDSDPDGFSDNSGSITVSITVSD